MTTIQGFGCGGLLKCKVRKVRFKLGNWLIDQFDIYEAHIRLPRDNKWDIHQENIHLILGISRGEKWCKWKL